MKMKPSTATTQRISCREYLVENISPGDPWLLFAYKYGSVLGSEAIVAIIDSLVSIAPVRQIIVVTLADCTLQSTPPTTTRSVVVSLLKPLPVIVIVVPPANDPCDGLILCITG